MTYNNMLWGSHVQYIRQTYQRRDLWESTVTTQKVSIINSSENEFPLLDPLSESHPLFPVCCTLHVFSATVVYITSVYVLCYFLKGLTKPFLNQSFYFVFVHCNNDCTFPLNVSAGTKAEKSKVFPVSVARFFSLNYFWSSQLPKNHKCSQ